MKEIRKIRLKQGISQLELANRLGIDRSTVAKWESGRINPRVSMLYEIAKALNCKVTDLLYLNT